MSKRDRTATRGAAATEVPKRPTLARHVEEALLELTGDDGEPRLDGTDPLLQKAAAIYLTAGGFVERGNRDRSAAGMSTEGKIRAGILRVSAAGREAAEQIIRWRRAESNGLGMKSYHRARYFGGLRFRDFVDRCIFRTFERRSDPQTLWIGDGILMLRLGGGEREAEHDCISHSGLEHMLERAEDTATRTGGSPTGPRIKPVGWWWNGTAMVVAFDEPDIHVRADYHDIVDRYWAPSYWSTAGRKGTESEVLAAWRLDEPQPVALLASRTINTDEPAGISRLRAAAQAPITRRSRKADGATDEPEGPKPGRKRRRAEA